MGSLSWLYHFTGAEVRLQVLISAAVPTFSGNYSITYTLDSPAGVTQNYRNVFRQSETGTVCNSTGRALFGGDTTKTDSGTVGVPAGPDPGFWSCTNFTWFQWQYDGDTQFVGAGHTLTITLTAAGLTSPCEYGVRIADPGRVVYYLTPALIDAVLVEFGAVWAVPFFTGLYFATYDISDICSGLPPPLPQPLTLDTFNHSPEQIWSLFHAMAWWYFCECTPGATTPVEPPRPPVVQPPGMPVQPTFPCDPAVLCNALVAIQKQLAALALVVGENYTLTGILQRFGLPFAYLPGTQHASLIGSGSFAVERLVGVRVDITSRPGGGRELVGNPPYLWDMGWMSVMTGDGMIEEKRIAQDPQIWQPRLMAEAITFGYWFNPGVVATVTELRPEP